MITFDGGHQSIGTNAYDVLLEFGFNAICFVATSNLRNPEYDTAQPSAEPRATSYLSWPEARALQATGVIDFQSHGHDPEKLAGCSPAQAKEDLGTSIDILTGQMDLPRAHYAHLAWPYGGSSEDLRSIAARTGFQYQYTVAQRNFAAGTRPDDIPRRPLNDAAFAQLRRDIEPVHAHRTLLRELFLSLKRNTRG